MSNSTDHRKTVVATERRRAPRRFESVGRPAWERQYSLALVGVDLAAVTLAAALSFLIRFSAGGGTFLGVSYVRLGAALVAVWVPFLGLSRAYEARFVGAGSEEFRRVFDASVRLLAVITTIAFAFQLPLARGYFGLAFPLGTVFLLLGRFIARRVLYRMRRSGRACHRVLVVGSRSASIELIREAASAPNAGLSVVGACVPGTEPLVVGDREIPVLGEPRDAVTCLDQCGADTVAVTGTGLMGTDGVRRLGWELEGSGVDLVVAPSVTNVAGPRITIRPVAGLSLLHVEEPAFTGVRRIFKTGFDKVVAFTVLLVASPLLLATAVAIKLDSHGPVFFRQTRVGIHGRQFKVWKFRSMLSGAEAMRAELENINENADGLLFKIKEDPRITRIGKHIRRFSIDELPQLLNVLRGDMSLVGPRPPLPSEVAEYGTDVYRRLLVKPGLTGLWQVSGRSNLSWEESVRLDLRYVENWSVAMDFMILWKTVGAVVHGRGAY